jgi:beta-1,4-mannosyl-glycoprotein beta-1,4-N-acetylglucosaminyltransferase
LRILNLIKNIFTNKKNLRSRVKNYKDLFDDNVNLKKITLDSSYPEYIIKNKKKFKEWFV